MHTQLALRKKNYTLRLDFIYEDIIMWKALSN